MESGHDESMCHALSANHFFADPLPTPDDLLCHLPLISTHSLVYSSVLTHSVISDSACSMTFYDILRMTQLASLYSSRTPRPYSPARSACGPCAASKGYISRVASLYLAPSSDLVNSRPAVLANHIPLFLSSLPCRVT